MVVGDTDDALNQLSVKVVSLTPELVPSEFVSVKGTDALREILVRPRQGRRETARFRITVGMVWMKPPKMCPLSSWMNCRARAKDGQFPLVGPNLRVSGSQ